MRSLHHHAANGFTHPNISSANTKERMTSQRCRHHVQCHDGQIDAVVFKGRQDRTNLHEQEQHHTQHGCRTQERRSDHQGPAEPAVLHLIKGIDSMALHKGCELKDGPESRWVSGIPKHQHGVGMFENATNAADSCCLALEVCLMDANPIEENARSRRPPQQERPKRQRNSEDQTPGTKVISGALQGKSPGVAGQKLKVEKARPHQCPEMTSHYGSKAIVNDRQHQHFPPWCCMPRMAPKAIDPGRLEAPIMEISSKVFLQDLALQGSGRTRGPQEFGIYHFHPGHLIDQCEAAHRDKLLRAPLFICPRNPDFCWCWHQGMATVDSLWEEPEFEILPSWLTGRVLQRELMTSFFKS